MLKLKDLLLPWKNLAVSLSKVWALNLWIKLSVVGVSIHLHKVQPILVFLSSCQRAKFKISVLLRKDWTVNFVGGKVKNLSWFGRETLIRSVAHAIPAYFMLAIQFPKGQCDQLDASVSRFWWSPKVHVGFQCHGLHFVGHKRRVAWVSGNSGILTKLFSPNLTGEFYPKRIVFVLRFEGEIQDSRQLVVSPFS